MFYMYVRLTKSKKSKHPTLQIVHGVRQGKKVKQNIIASLGVIKDQKDLKRILKLTEHLIRCLEKEGLPIDHKVDIKSLIHKMTTYDGFGVVVDRMMHLSKFVKILEKAQGNRHFDLKETIKLIITQRLALPSSKLRTYERQQDHGFQNIDLQDIYRSMDAIEPFSIEFQKQAFETLRTFSSHPLDCFFFDVTTLYFESVEQDEIRDFGFSKDQKYHCVQVVFALVVDSQGMPIAYELFQGNLAETKTLIPVLNTLRKRFAIKNITVVCDRGMASKANIEALRYEQFHYVIATKLKSIAKKHQLNDLSNYSPLPHQDNVPEQEKILFRTLNHPQYEDTQLIITYSPKRAEKDRKDRERLLEKLQKKLAISNETSVKKTISNGGYKKFINVKKGSLITISQVAVNEDVAWDGFHGIAVSNSSSLSVTEALVRYRNLWRVEESFRIAKSTLRTRPIFHWKPQRIRSHILLCFLTLFFERFLEMRLRQSGKPLTPDRIRYALSGVHTMFFEEIGTAKEGIIDSKLSEDAANIFEVLEISTDRQASIKTACCV